LGYAVYHFFANGGRTAYVTRVAASAGAKAKSGSILGTIGSSSSSVTLFKVEANNKGTWANWVKKEATVTNETGLRVTLTAGLRNGVAESLGGTGTPRTFNLGVYFNGVEVERWTEVSLDPDSTQYIPTIVNNYSTYIKVVDIDAGLVAGVAYTVVVASTDYTSGAPGTGHYALGDTTSSGDVDGTDGTVADADWTNALNSLDSVAGSLLINLVGQSSGIRVNAALAYAESRGNGFVIIDPDATKTSANDIKDLTNTYSKSSYGAVYYPLIKMPDPARSGTATLRDTFPGGALAGLFSRVEQERTVAKAPAGYAYELRNAFGLSTNFIDSQVGILYDSHINALKVVPGGGIIVNGARTLKRTDITKFVPVRRTLNFIKSNVDTIASYSVFEPNGERVWTDINTRISRFLSDLWAAGGLKGRNATEAFYIICDATNNPAYSVENGELHVEVGVALQAPAEFIIINISQFAGGSSTAAEAV
jgi:phage tail sheath protein FI